MGDGGSERSITSVNIFYAWNFSWLRVELWRVLAVIARCFGATGGERSYGDRKIICV